MTSPVKSEYYSEERKALKLMGAAKVVIEENFSTKCPR
jgi:hypothetical protein